MYAASGSLEWLSTNSFGSFALGCADRRLRRKYHGLFTVREPGHGGPWSVLAELRELVTRQGQGTMLWDPVREHDASAMLRDFTALPQPVHTYLLPDGLEVERSLRLAENHDQVELTYRVRGVREPLELALMPLLRCRPVHDLTRENPFLDGSFTFEGAEARMVPYAGMPPIAFAVHGAPYRLVQRGKWHRDVSYAWEAERGYPHVEDLFCPGSFALHLERDGDVTFVVALSHTVTPAPREASHASVTLADKLERAAAQFGVVTRDGARDVVAGYPWFGPYARDTLIALPGLHLASGDFGRTEAILDTLLATRVDGLIPNIAPLDGARTTSLSADTNLLFVRAIQWLAEQEGEARVARFMPAVCDLLEALEASRDPRVRLDDGIGVWMERGPWALTWMDARVADVPVTPRAGYAVDTDALAFNAAHFALAWADRQRGSFARAFKPRVRDAQVRFLARFWDTARGYLADAYDGSIPDGSLRPNQLWALGLPHRPVPVSVARSSLDVVTRELLTPTGLRTLARSDTRYRGSYGGGVAERDQAYHQGTVWPWLLGIYADAVMATYGRDALEPLIAPSLERFVHHLEAEACIGQVSEVFSGDAPHVPGGAPAQAWSVAELYRAQRMLTAKVQTSARAPSTLGKKSQSAKEDMAEKRQ